MLNTMPRKMGDPFIAFRRGKMTEKFGEQVQVPRDNRSDRAVNAESRNFSQASAKIFQEFSARLFWSQIKESKPNSAEHRMNPHYVQTNNLIQGL